MTLSLGQEFNSVSNYSRTKSMCLDGAQQQVPATTTFLLDHRQRMVTTSECLTIMQKGTHDFTQRAYLKRLHAELTCVHHEGAPRMEPSRTFSSFRETIFTPSKHVLWVSWFATPFYVTIEMHKL